MILHGTRCIQCERGDLPEPPSFIADALRAARAGKFHDGGFIPKSLRATGFDTASGPDRTATGTYQRVNDKIHFTADDLKTAWTSPLNGDDERMEAMRKRFDDVLRESARGRDYYTFPDPPWDPEKMRDRARRFWESRPDPRVRPEHMNCRSTIRPQWGDGTPMTEDEADLMNGRYRGADIITDPNDHRGVNARKIGESRA